MHHVRWLPTLVAFDTETTGLDVFNDRIVTASVVHAGPSGVGLKQNWLINPGVEIPEGAARIHGVTTERARNEGKPAAGAVAEIAKALRLAWDFGAAVVAMNAAYDLTLLQAELARYGHEPLTIGPVLDPLCIDRAMDPYRKGKRTLTALAEHYRAKHEGAHSSEGDALAAARVVWQQARAYVHLADMSMEDMQDLQRNAHRDWAAHLEQHRRSLGNAANVNGEWPVRTVPAAVEAAA